MKTRTVEEIENEIEELEADQHPDYYKNESEGRLKMMKLLKELNTAKKKTKVTKQTKTFQLSLW